MEQPIDRSGDRDRAPSDEPSRFLDELEAHLAALESDPYDEAGALTPPSPPGPGAGALTPDDQARASELLARLDQAMERTAGLQTRVMGELTGLRRPRRFEPVRAARHFDVET